MSYIAIESNEALAEAAQKWLSVPRIALDSEFMRVDTFFPKLALVQINDGEHTYLIDPLAITEWEPLKAVFTAENVVKVLHSCSEDLDAFYSNLGVLPRPIFDTQLAASYASVGGVMGYQRLVKALLDVDLEKGETRSDWLKRPLSDSQKHYAAEDVNHLLPMAEMLEQKLIEKDRLTWLVQDCVDLLDDWLVSQAEGYSHERVKKAWMLKGHQLNVLAHLVKWREERCHKLNKPRGHIINDALLVEVAQRLPQSVQQLSKIKGIKGPTLRKEGEQIVQLIQACKDTPKEQWPPRMERPLSQAAGEWFKDMRKLVNRIAEDLDVPPELLARKKQLEWMLRRGYPDGPFTLHDALTGWREPVIGEPVLKLLNELAQK